MTDCKKMEQTEDLRSITLYTTETVLEEEDEVIKDNAVYTTIFTIKTMFSHTKCYMFQPRRVTNNHQAQNVQKDSSYHLKCFSF